ncbi:MAG: TrpB-like pyridoxal phosphate-dependent enzyme [Armatimonadetes bacterium]|nr:TrpB-like pyridoxal phosphate-dependent enzyme [Armatimonadota bacterium]NIM23182.1 TrpB-like pyridoxal phosphate-dependent enzyme [Armatimonadota bacterium]NIM67050.1 TrpB-like pyridoxal phosphate-dependent enzyme [Armatimonadota bacterium]NIM75584.1 TrpB-like pyridoxal phosphate-dependent enzyme [Armatimonadota bacterium]NIN05239.1 TrpB-like pyridoxal phosphate-dependent enzyme [Armatimonadota bacterium]
MASDETKILLRESEMPQRWYNINPDLPAPLAPPIHPGTGQPVGPEDLAPIFPMELIKQEVSMEPYIEIPDEIQRIYRLWRPSPLYRAHRLEKALKTPARIYYKNESFSPPGSHKPNTAVAQAYYNKQEGVKRLCTETGAGQWGSALSFGCSLFGIECTVYMVKVSYEQKPYRRVLMETWGSTVHPSPTKLTNAGRTILEKDPNSPGSLGIAISEAVEDAATHDDAKYSLGSVLNHVLLHQTIVGQEVKAQLKLVDEEPDVIVGCVGGGSNFAGVAFPFVKDKLNGKKIDIIACEPEACPTLTRGVYRYDFGDTAMLTPLLKMHTLGHTFVPEPIHAGGLRYHGDAPLVSLLVSQNVIEPRAYHQLPTFEAALNFARTEGSLPAPETAHALRGAIDEALKCKETGEEKCILIAYSGHGFFDLGAYEKYLSGQLEDYEYPKEKIEAALKELPEVAAP